MVAAVDTPTAVALVKPRVEGSLATPRVIVIVMPGGRARLGFGIVASNDKGRYQLQLQLPLSVISGIQ